MAFVRKVLLLWGFLLLTNWAQDLPKGLTSEEKLLMKNYLSPVAEGALLAPPNARVRTMAEWEELDGILITWTSYQSILAQIVDHAQEEGNVYIVCSDSNTVKSYLTNQSIPHKNLKFLLKPFNSIWSRDYGPWMVYKNGADSLYMIDWKYNRPRPNDDIIPAAFAAYYNTPLYQMVGSPDEVIATGGNYMTDGLGTAFSSKLILQENPSRTSSDIDTLMKRYMGINRYVKMDVLPYDGIHHIDMHMKLLDEETILVGQYPSGVSDGPQIEANLQYILTNYLTCYGRPYKVIRIPMPPDGSNQYPNAGGDYRTYTNSTFVNKTVLVPTYELKYDTTALRIYREAMSGYKIIGINCNSIIPASGAIHCINKEIGVKEPVFIALPPPVNLHTNVFRFKAYARTVSGIASVKLYYSTDTLSGYNSVLMSAAGADTFTAEVQLPAGAKKLFYYADAASNSGKTIRKPMTAPAGALQMSVDFTVPVELSLFEGYFKDGSNILYWMTGSEKNNRGFEIERAISSEGEGGSWHVVGFVPGRGTTAEITRYTFTDNSLAAANYAYRLKQIDFDGTVSCSKEINIRSDVPSSLSLEQNYPNPARGETVIRYRIPSDGRVTLKIYDVLGEEVAGIVDEVRKPGEYSAKFNAAHLTPGIYFYKFTSDNETIIRKLMVMH